MAAVVELNAVWLNSATDPSDAMSFTMVGDSLKVQSSVSASALEMAGGETLLLTSPGQKWSANPTFPQCTPEQVAFLNRLEGQIVCFRDHQGTKFFGFYSQVPVSESTLHRDQGDAELSITSVTWSEAV